MRRYALPDKCFQAKFSVSCRSFPPKTSGSRPPVAVAFCLQNALQVAVRYVAWSASATLGRAQEVGLSVVIESPGT